MARYFIFFFVFFMFFSTVILQADDETVIIEPRYWSTDLTADGLIEEDGIGTPIDFASDLGMEDADVPALRFAIHTGPKSRLRFDYASADFDGDNILTRTIEFSGQTYTVNSRVLSDLQADFISAGWVWQFLRDDGDMIHFGTLVEAKALSFDASIEAPDYNEEADDSLDVVIPAVGFALDLYPHDRVHLSLEATGISAGDNGSLLDAEAGFGYRIADFLKIAGGYRVLDIEAEDEPDYLNLKLSGPFLSVHFMF